MELPVPFKASKNRYLPGLEIFRGALAVWVMLAHTAMLCGVQSVPNPKIAVCGFMMLSGFLMVWQWESKTHVVKANEIAPWKRFLIRRFFRIAPLHYLFLIPSFLLFTQYAQWRHDIDLTFALTARNYGSLDVFNVLAHMTYIFGLIPKFANSVIIPDWSIGLEMQFYALFPLAVISARKIGFVGMTILVVGLIHLIHFTAIGSGFPEPSFLGLNLGLFWIGMLLAYFHGSSTTSARLRSLIAIALLLKFGLFSKSQLMMTGLTYILALYTGIEMGINQSNASFFEKVATRIALRCERFGILVGKISYGLYLVHLLILIPVLALLIHYPFFLNLRPLFRFGIVSPLIVLPSALMAVLASRFIEDPCIERGRKLVTGIQSNARETLDKAA